MIEAANPAAQGREHRVGRRLWDGYATPDAARLQAEWSAAAGAPFRSHALASGSAALTHDIDSHGAATGSLHLVRIRERPLSDPIDDPLIRAAVLRHREPMVVTDARAAPLGDRVLWANTAFYRLMGSEDGEAVDIRPSSCCTDGARLDIRRQLPAARDGHPIQGCSHFRRTDGSEFLAQWRLAPVVVDGRVRWWVMTGRDVTEQTRIDNLLAMQRGLRQDSKGIARSSEIVSGTVHDMNNALTIIQNLTALAIEDITDEALTEDLGMVLDAATEATTQARTLSAFGRRGMAPLGTRDNFDVDQSLAQNLDVLRRAVPRRIDMKRELEAGCVLYGSESMLQQVLCHLLANARDAIPDQGCVTVRSRTVDGAGRESVEIEIEDDGAGMPAGVSARVLNGREFASRVYGPGGGLEKVAALVRQQGGALHIGAGTAGTGTLVRISLPRSRAPDRPTPASTALVLEDDAATRKRLAHLLTRQGITAITAATAEEALAVEGPSPRLIIIDLARGAEDGADIAAHLHAKHPSAHLVLATTALVPPGEPAPFPFTHLLHKPFAAGDIGRLLRRLKSE